ncbi:MAG: hypothetical protein WCJ95_09025 [Mariniphaga sp.]
MNQIIKYAGDFIEICRKLKQAEYKKKEIATILDIPAPVLSSLLKTVLPSIAKISESLSTEERETAIASAFMMVNNLSRTKIEKRLPNDISKLTNLTDNKDFKRIHKSGYLNFITKQAELSFEYIAKHFQGIYYFYYLSSDTDQLKGDPFIIKPNVVEKIVEVYKGNTQSSVNYFGIALLNNNHTITIQLAENHESPEEYLQVIVSLPFIRKVDYLRGIFSNINFSRQPIARKVVLHKVSDQCEWKLFNAMDVKRLSSESASEIPEIERYLCSDNSRTECFAISKPSFTLSDLDDEIRLSREVKLPVKN